MILFKFTRSNLFRTALLIWIWIWYLDFYTIGIKSVRFSEEDSTESAILDNNLEISANKEENNTGIREILNITITMDTEELTITGSSYTSEGKY